MKLEPKPQRIGVVTYQHDVGVYVYQADIDAAIEIATTRFHASNPRVRASVGQVDVFWDVFLGA